MQVVVLASVAILLEAALAFLGVGIPPPTQVGGKCFGPGNRFFTRHPTMQCFRVSSSR